jgi:nucleotide-binding universal stress UspA family protein
MNSGTVVVGTDLSGASAEAISQAAAWAKRSNGVLVVVHVAPDEIFRALETPHVASALQDRVDGIVRPLGLSFDVALEAGSPHSALIKVADERHAALVVVGAAGAHGESRSAFGGTAERVVRYAHCPVLVARAANAAGPVLAATDFSTESEHGIEVAAREAERRGVTLCLVHSLYEPVSTLSLLGPIVMSPPEITEEERADLRVAAEQTLRTLLESHRARGDVAVLSGPPADAVTAHAAKIGASLVVVSTRGRTGLARIALGSVAEAIAERSPCSVLAVRNDSAGHAKH